MTNPIDPVTLLSNNFRTFLVGTLSRGIVHNLNGSIQALFMLSELLKAQARSGLKCVDSLKELSLRRDTKEMIAELEHILNKSRDFLTEMDKALSGTEKMISLIADRTSGRDSLVKPVILNHLIQEELDFWKGDLIFKHKVESQIDLPTEPPLIVVDEMAMRDLVDAIIAACMEQVRDTPEKRLTVQLVKNAPNELSLTFGHSGTPFPSELQGTKLPSPSDNGDQKASGEKIDLLPLSLAVAKRSAAVLGWDVAIKPQTISCRINA